MDLLTILRQKREAVLGRWFDLIIDTYPADTSDFLAKQKDRFENPVGYAISSGIETIYSQILTGFDAPALSGALDGIIRIRSVQEFKPSEAVVFVFQLKTAIREVVLGTSGGAVSQVSGTMAGELAGVEAKIDEIALVAFDKYTECREKLHEVRTNEIKKRTALLLDRVNERPGQSSNKGDTVDDVT
jgi:hypothetical protein